MDNPVPKGRRRRSGSLQGSLPRQGSTADVEQIVAFPAREGLQGFRPGQGSSSSRFLQDEDAGCQGGFRTFPWPKKSAKDTRQSSPRVPASVSSSELGAHQMAPAADELEDEPGERTYRGGGGSSEGVTVKVEVVVAGGRRWVGGGRRRLCALAGCRRSSHRC